MNMPKKGTEKVYMVAISLFVIIANSWHVISEWLINDPSRYFVGIAHYYSDYFLYTSYIAQGARGAWVHAYHMYTNEPLRAFWYYWMYVAMGHVGSWFHFSPFATYDIGLTGIITLLIISISILIHHIFPHEPAKRHVAVLFVLTASDFPDLAVFIKTGVWKLFGLTWFSPSPALNRLGGVPHQTLQTALLCTIMWLYATSQEQSRFRMIKLVVLYILAFFTATIAPVQMFLLIISIALMFIVPRMRRIATKQVSVSTILRESIPFVSVAIAAVAGVLVANHEIANQSIFAMARVWERKQYTTMTLLELYVGMGPIALFIPFGVLSYIKKLNTLRGIVLIYGLLSIASFYSPLPALLDVASIRWLSPSGYIIFPILAVEGIMEFSKGSAQLLSFLTHRTLKQSLIFSCLMIAYIVCTIPAIVAQIYTRTVPLRSEARIIALNHVSMSAVTAIRSINTSHVSMSQPVVLTDPTLPYDIIIPPLTGLRSFTGHIIHTLDNDAKQSLRQSFFAGYENDSEAMNFLKTHSIAYIITPSESTVMARYPFLRLIFRNETLSVYTVLSK
jgi:hypothetical protein